MLPGRNLDAAFAVSNQLATVLQPRNKYQAFVSYAAILLLACDSNDDRHAWLHQRLVEDSQMVLDREPELARLKWRKMAVSPYDFFRGTLSVFVADARLGAFSQLFPSGDSSAGKLLLLGDPYIENVGTMSDGSTVRLEWNDFDAAAFGPYDLDLRRLLVSFAILARQGFPEQAELPSELTRAALDGYCQEIATANPTLFSLDAGSGNELVVGHIADAKKALDEHMLTHRYSVVVGQRRWLSLIEHDPQNLTLPADELQKIPAQWQDFAEQLDVAGKFSYRSFARRLGTGIASVGNIRILGMFSEDTAAEPVFREWKEISEATATGWMFPQGLKRFASNAERWIAGANVYAPSFQGSGLSAVNGGVLSFRARNMSSAEDSMSVDKISESVVDGSLGTEALLDFARLVGKLLANRHLYAPTLDGSRGRDVLPDALKSDNACDLVASWADQYSQQIMVDWQWFNASFGAMSEGSL